VAEGCSTSGSLRRTDRNLAALRLAALRRRGVTLRELDVISALAVSGTDAEAAARVGIALRQLSRHIEA
jgi:hypothetical protein